MTDYIIPLLLAGVALFALGRRENVYEELLTGAAGGLKLLVSIVPALIALLTAVHMLRASGAMEAAASFLSPVFSFLGIPPETAALVLVRPISGSAALAVGADLMAQYGPDSPIGRTAAIMLGSTETTFYTISVYFGAAGAPDPICRPCSAFGRSHRLLHGFPHRPVVFLKFSLYFSPAFGIVKGTKTASEEYTMEKILNLISAKMADAFEAAGFDRSYGRVTVSNRPDLCEYQCNGALAAAKAYHKAPIQIAQAVAEQLHHEDFESVATAMPGFINLRVSGSFLQAYLSAMRHDPYFGVEQEPVPKTIVVDYGGPNVAKPLHIGHLRSAIIGESMKRIYKFFGNHTIGDVHLGDWGAANGPHHRRTSGQAAGAVLF